MKMDLVVFLLTFTMFWKNSLCLQCYACDPEHTPSAPSCEHFDYSDKYITNCPSSDMCYKRITTMEFGNGGTVLYTQRGCAPQTMDGEQEKINGKWRLVNRIHNVYEENCSQIPNDGERSTNTVHCYCRGDKCNQAGRLKKSCILAFVTGLMLILLN